LLTDPIKILHNICVGKTNDCDPKILQVARSLHIVLHSGSFAMLRAIQLNSKFCLVAEKIQDITSNDLLTAETGATVAKKVKPQMPFFLGHIFA
jgi:hypothetical protein